MYGFNITVPGTLSQVEERVREELQKEGFGVLTEIDVAATLKKKLGVERRPYRILGACNPGMAFKALAAEKRIGTMLPCNVIVFETARRDGVHVGFLEYLKVGAPLTLATLALAWAVLSLR